MNARLPVSKECLAEFCVKHGIRRLSLFGSALREDFNQDSDPDILVEFEPSRRVSLRFFEIEHELSDLLGRPVDLNTVDFLSPYFRDEVLREAQEQYHAA